MDRINEIELSGIWQAVDEVMREKYTGTKQSYDLWFGRMKLSLLDTSRAVLVCENKMKQSIVSERYLSLISESFREAIGYAPSVTIEIDPALAPAVNPIDPPTRDHQNPGNPAPETPPSRQSSARSASRPGYPGVDEHAYGNDFYDDS